MSYLLDSGKKEIANKTLSAYAFYYLVMDRLERIKQGEPEGLSTVRMGDGEAVLFQDCLDYFENCDHDSVAELVSSYDEAWRIRMGVEGISWSELYLRMTSAGNLADYFGPSVSGLAMSTFDLYRYFQPRDQYLDNFFVNIWDDKYKERMFKLAGHVVLLHRNRGTADALQRRCKEYFDVKVTYFELDNWRQGDDLIEQVSATDANLVLFSGGPAIKYISPEISKSGKVVLDIGNSIDQWLFYPEFLKRKQAAEIAQ